MTSAEIRQQFLDFFASKQHQIVPSAPIVVKNDPTLLFTNAGMNQFKDYFLGNSKPSSTRIADTQKCLRVSGKHNDLEEVGVDTYHHTMFEMLGNWSFGDYFKAEAIAWSWELLTEVYKLPKDRLYVTVFEGDPAEGIPASTIALAEWQKLVAPDHIVYGNKKDNFWEMGDTGPCGPCSEIHVDCRSEEEIAKIPGRDLVNKDHPQVIEIWNNVFIQYNRLKDGSLVELPAKHVDTGMGFERLVRVIQGKQSNYDTDVFTGTFRAIEKITGNTYDQSNSKEAIAFRVIADHIRAIGFTIADGQLPSNTGAGYVIRRILRRAVRYYYSYLNYKQPLLFQLIPVIAEQFKNVFPELHQQLDFVCKVVKEEEDAFLKTLDKGLKRMDDIIKNSGSVIDGKAAFELFDTFGFPIDLTRLIATEHNKSIDEQGFEKEMQEQKNRSRAATTLDTEDWVDISTEKGNGFVGYNELSTTSKITRYRKISSKGKTQFQLVLNTTPFYAESGGQVGDTGKLIFSNDTISVTNTKKENDLIVHFVDQLPMNPAAEFTAEVDAAKRLFTCYNHTATHLLHAALRQVLGTHVAQKGSLVNEENLRFDFSHFARLTEEEIIAVENIVNGKIRENIPVVIKEMSKDEALQLGAMALFGEKYGDRVRVVIADPSYSVELCGGTHVASTGMIGLMKITAESAVAAGVRRIEALTGKAAFDYLSVQNETLKQIGNVLKSQDALRSIEKLIAEKQELEKKLESLEAKQLQLIKTELIQKIKPYPSGNGQFIGEILPVSSPDHLKKICFELKASLAEDYVVVLCANINGKAAVCILLSDAVVAQKGLEAPQLIKQYATPLIKGGGGGQKTLATAGGQDASNLSTLIQQIYSLL
ncbi:alanine--tRNA ligase [Sediminibacterium sp. TEGAF015]|uniref:alanine--tRNA ligase n=1 Tax=Sediminibacterium sp. TEGAF015 TaxID=575378 RepID=UPI0022024E88|nr:alanine--tRNA ligase [Sediminibacterium sp. TEGAF015]BDQ12381.1 alanine--tRNA ligase [Sediminibacterium sp. TEGAF015]